MRATTRRLAVVAAAAAVLIGTLSAQAVPAGATDTAPAGMATNPYSPTYGHHYRHGAVPTSSQAKKIKDYANTHAGSAGTATGPETLGYGGGIDGIGVTSSTPKVYLVFWGSQWGTQGTDAGGNLTFSHDSSAGAPYIQNLFKGLGTGGELWSATMTQYCDGPSVARGATSCPSGAPHVGYPAGGAFAGVWYDPSSSEPTSASGHQIGTEAASAAAHFGNTTAASNRYAQYDILSAPGLNPDNYLNNGLSKQIAASDSASGQTLTYAATGLPAGLSINSSSGLVSGTPTTANTYSVTVTATDTTGANGSTSFSWTIQSSGTSCSNPGQTFANPGFESGSSGWSATSGVITTDGAHSHTGGGYAWLDGYGRTWTDTLSQAVAIPATCHATLSYYLWISSNEPTSPVDDTLVVTANGTTIQSFSQANKGSGYVLHTVDVSAFAGQSVTITWTGSEHTRVRGVTSFFVDDTALILS